MFQNVLTSLRQAKSSVEEAARQIRDNAKKCAKDVSGARDRQTLYQGSVAVRNVSDMKLFLHVASSSVAGTKLAILELAPGQSTNYDPGETTDFDFFLTVATPEQGVRRAKGNVVRTAAYRVSVELPKAEDELQGLAVERKLVLEQISPPQRKRSDRLASTPGLSFTFSASGWLFVYQLGVAACLQDHGISRNPHVRVSGASGGALTAATMMYGCDMHMLCDHVRRFAMEARKAPSQAVNLRYFILEVMKTVVRDGSVLHPAFQSGRVEIAVSESGLEVNQTLSESANGLLKGKTQLSRQRRVKQFEKSSDAVIALLASATMGISGLPFKWKNAEGKEVRVADGALTDFMPRIDDNSVTVKSFSDGLNLASGRADVAPTEFVPGTWGLLPPAAATVDHLFELGYRDMEAWLDQHLAERLEKVQASEAQRVAPADRSVDSAEASSQAAASETNVDLPPVSFTCEDHGMEWLTEVLEVVPITLSEQFGRQTPKASKKFAPQPRRFAPLPDTGADGARSDGEEGDFGPSWSLTMSPPCSPRASPEQSPEVSPSFGTLTPREGVSNPTFPQEASEETPAPVFVRRDRGRQLAQEEELRNLLAASLVKAADEDLGEGEAKAESPACSGAERGIEREAADINSSASHEPSDLPQPAEDKSACAEEADCIVELHPPAGAPAQDTELRLDASQGTQQERDAATV
mmetsp:Transcript_1177/g.2607  ORF Transcript_1177/g.2607 Transcript_1177/m.2607 type:complete len:696 (-) Transcript_1177:129-2216(-)